MGGVPSNSISEHLHFNMIGYAAGMVEQHANRHITGIRQPLEPGFGSQPVPDLVIKSDFLLVYELQERRGNECFSHAARKHTILRPHGSVPLAVCASNR